MRLGWASLFSLLCLGNGCMAAEANPGLDEFDVESDKQGSHCGQPAGVFVSKDFATWFNAMGDKNQAKATYLLQLLQNKGVLLGHPHATKINQSEITRLFELRGNAEESSKVLRIFYVFGNDRSAYALVGFLKSGNAEYDPAVKRVEELWDLQRAAPRYPQEVISWQRFAQEPSVFDQAVRRP